MSWLVILSFLSALSGGNITTRVTECYEVTIPESSSIPACLAHTYRP